MANGRKQDVLIEDLTASNGCYIVWTDDPAKAIGEIEGVTTASQRSKGRVMVWLDPRYDADTVLARIEAL